MKTSCRKISFLLFLLSICRTGLSAENAAPVYVPEGAEKAESQTALPTVTVRGFLNFRTTVDGTVIVFTPASEAARPSAGGPSSTSGPSVSANAIGDSGEGSEEAGEMAYTKSPDSLALSKNGQLDGVVRESFGHLNAVLHSADNVIPVRTQTDAGHSRFGADDIKSTRGPAPASPQYPTGLVTVLGGTHIENGATTVFETKVVGTYIDGKYAQILQSTSRILGGASTRSDSLSARIKPTPTPVVSKSESTDSATTRYTRTTSKPQNRRGNVRKEQAFSSHASLRSSFKLPDTSRYRSAHPTRSLDAFRAGSSSSAAGSRPSATPPSDEDNTVFTRRPPNGRLRFVLPKRNTQTVRLNRFKVKLTVRQDPDLNEHNSQDDESITGEIPYEEDPLISVDPARVVYQRTTITSEVTLHVGRRKSVRTLTIITTVPKTVHQSAYVSNGIQEISPAQNGLATSVAEGETPPVVVSRTYTTTERTWRTSLLPILDGDSTSFHTVTESFFILKIITAYKTMPPGEVTIPPEEINAVPTLDAGFNAQTGLLNGAVPLPPSPQQQLLQTPLPQSPMLQGSGIDNSYLPLGANSGTIPLQLANPLISLGVALQQNPLAAVYLGLQQLNRHVTLYSTITKTSTYVTTDTVYSTKVVSFYDGRHTRSRTLSESLSTTERTVTNYTTTVRPYLNTQAIQQQQQLQQLIATHLPPPLPPPPQFTTLTSTYTTVTTATSYSTRVYTLTYNAFSTKFRTVTSSSVYETTVTTTSTTEVPLQPTAPPAAYPYFG
ncbi:uncharacterized protein LOC111624622 [Centruroides sculpturatus]|uniref:uncharacterized protein LOC111624622 n=1 Tax=Centruroides sculpturatus TaxID=218467 RepID=UPI000C6CE0BD|nr:uncharacterized protein LOC111624622 [Centruroides sculpturatus]